jgi:hypothetical protein
MPFPQDTYTPYGYLDTPTHTRNLSPRGVLRSHGAGFRWHYPAYAGMYGGRRETYRAGFRIAIDGALDLAEFDRVACPEHSKNVFVFFLSGGDATDVAILYHAVGEHALRARVAGADRVDRLTVHVEYARLLAANGEWGESGLVGRVEDGALVLQGFEDGDAFVLWSSEPWSDAGVTADPALAADWAASPAPGLPPERFVAATGRPGELVQLHAVLGFAPARDLDIMFARGKTVDEARLRLDAARRSAEREHARLRADDDAFWSRVPRLVGDWPDHWRRGLVYDLETLRMMVKRPIGIYRHIWDAMQIHAPRVVLAETAIDALLLSYADPALAQELMLGLFLDAPEPNIPCSREDGSYNMVAADGAACGTAPPWGYPWLALAWLDALHPDRAWLERLYPRLAEYLDWRLAHRRDADGWLVYACSWESGQDDSPRFGAQPLGGGHPVRHVRPVDLHAAFAHACQVMASLAGRLGRARDATTWAALAHEFARRTDQLWNGHGAADAGSPPRYADFDVRAGRFTQVDDVMLLAPLALGVAAPERVDALRPIVQGIDAATLVWPMGAWTAVEAATAAGLHDTAAELAAAICERAYGFWDARPALPERTLPGISCEYWPPSGRCGGEGYGWGAFTTHLLLHTLVGVTPTHEGLQVRPNVPAAWRVPGRRYSVSLHWREQPVAITLEPLGGERVAVTVNDHKEEVGWGDMVVCSWESIPTVL